LTVIPVFSSISSSAWLKTKELINTQIMEIGFIKNLAWFTKVNSS
jgi:hypothetical protein